MSATKPEVEINFERKQMAKRFQRLRTHIFDHVLPEYDSADIVRHRETTIDVVPKHFIESIN